MLSIQEILYWIQVLVLDINSGARGPSEELLDQPDQPPAGEYTQHVSTPDWKPLGRFIDQWRNDTSIDARFRTEKTRMTSSRVQTAATT